MFKNALSRKMFGILGTFLMALNSFAWGPWDRGTDLRKKYSPEVKPSYKDPLLPFVHADSRVSVGQFRELIGALSPEQRKDLWKALEGKDANPPAVVTPEDLESKLRWVSSSWITFPFNKGSFDYHETVKWVAGKVGVHKAECEGGTTFQLERRIMEKLFAKLWDKLTQEQKEKILKDAGLEPSQVTSYSTLTASALLAAMGTTSALLGFTFYIIVAKTLVVVMAALGIPAAATISAVAMLCGPIGWIIAGTSAVIGLLLLGQPNAMKTAAFVIALHSIKATAMARSGVDVSKYVLK